VCGHSDCGKQPGDCDSSNAEELTSPLVRGDRDCGKRPGDCYSSNAEEFASPLARYNHILLISVPT
jgi:hypothetical protein